VSERPSARSNWARRDDGVTLIELLVSMTIFSLVIAGAYSALITVQRQTRDQTSRADAVGEARLALQTIDRQVRSGNIIYNPTGAGELPMSMRIYTQANGDKRCVQWQVAGNVLRSRSWEPVIGGAVSGWSVVARYLVNESAPITQPFTLQGGSTAYGSRLIDITLRVKSPTARGEPIDVTSSLSGRNTAYGYDPSTCNPVP
jgi:prepilin-type N-terminal cleavage/methylation domain-containing protein